jgi:hypothetical protein
MATPRVNAATVHVGEGYDMYGKSRDGYPYCRLDVAKQIEEELNAANARIAEMEDKIRRCDNNLMVAGGDMCDNGWITISSSNKRIALAVQTAIENERDRVYSREE